MTTHEVTDRRWLGNRAVIVTMAMATATALASLTLVSQASALAPSGDFAVFAQCPRFNPEVGLCLYSKTESGSVTIGTSTVPIKKPIVLQGGVATNEVTEVESLVGALNGETLVKSPQQVPGGLLGVVAPEVLPPFLQQIFNDFINKGVTGVTATTELARPASAVGINTTNLVNGEGTALSLPVKVKLDNPFLGNECYIGSAASPVTLNLTSGTTSPPPPNKPISGNAGKLIFKDEFKLVEIINNTLVDNAFSAPAASGCGGILSLLVDPAVNVTLGLPSAAGRNTAIQNNIVDEASGQAVIASEK
jgi:hypothetical protein